MERLLSDLNHPVITLSRSRRAKKAGPETVLHMSLGPLILIYAG